MVAYSFKARFIDGILAGTKDQTIRADRRQGHAEAGDRVQLYTAMRTKRCALILESVCLHSFRVLLRWRPVIEFQVEGTRVPVAEMDAFARRDGFADVDDMAAFWGDVERFAGQLIRWAPPAHPAEMGARL